MAKREKDKIYYEITREKPFGTFYMLMVGGASGSVLSFLIVSLVGAYSGMEMDALVLSFLVATFLGFFFGGMLVWLCLKYFDQYLPFSLLMGGVTEKPPVEAVAEPLPEVPASPVVEDEEAKGKSVDFVFPELSPDK
jgi:hypothetical protein